MRKGLPVGGSFAFRDTEKGCKIRPLSRHKSEIGAKGYYPYLPRNMENSA